MALKRAAQRPHQQLPSTAFAFHATSMAFYWRSSLPFASREISQTLQKTPKPFWYPCPRTPRHQGRIHGFSWPSTPHQWLFTGVQACRLPAVKRSNAPKGSKPFWHPCPRTPRHQGHIHGFSWPSTPHQWLFTGVQACRLPAVKRSKPSKKLQNPFGTHHKAISAAFLSLPRHINGFLLAFKPAVCQP